MANYAADAAELLSKQGCSVRVVDMRWVKPLDLEAIAAAAETGAVVTVEDGVRIGGAGEGVAEALALMGVAPKVKVLGLPDSFVAQGKVGQLFADVGIDAEGIAKAVAELLG